MKNKEVEQQHIKFQDRFNKDRLKYGMPEENFKMIAIGYLDSLESFEKGEVSTNFLTKLRVLWSEGCVLGSLGFHECEFCEGGFGTGDRAKSSTEKELTDKENKIKYFFPEMIFHYIKSHKFKPSNEFIEFVMKT